MRLVIGVEPFDDKLLKMFETELSAHADCEIIKTDKEISVRTEGSVVQCMCIVAICDKYRFGKNLSRVGGEPG